MCARPPRARTESAPFIPGPQAYDKEGPRGRARRVQGEHGKTFALPPEILASRGYSSKEAVPDAHDMAKMVAHLRDLPAPDAYTPGNPTAKNKGFRIVPSKAPSTLDAVIIEAGKVPGPVRARARTARTSLASPRATRAITGATTLAVRAERHAERAACRVHAACRRERTSTSRSW